MHMHSPDPQSRQAGRHFVNPLRPLDRDAELVFVGAGRDFGVGAGVDIRIDPNGNRSFHPQPLGHSIDAFQFGFALRIESVDSHLQSLLDFRHGLAHSGEQTVAALTAGGLNTGEFPATHHVKTASQPGEQP